LKTHEAVEPVALGKVCWFNYHRLPEPLGYIRRFKLMQLYVMDQVV